MSRTLSHSQQAITAIALALAVISIKDELNKCSERAKEKPEPRSPPHLTNEVLQHLQSTVRDGLPMSFSSFAKASFLIEIAFGSDGGRTDCSELVQNLISGTASDVDAVASIFKSIVVDMTRREPENDDKFGALASNVQQFWNMLLASPSTQMSFLIGEKFIEAQVLALMELCTSDHDEEDLLERCSLYERLGSLGILLQLSVLGLRDAARLAVGPLQGAVFQVETSTLRLLAHACDRVAHFPLLTARFHCIVEELRRG